MAQAPAIGSVDSGYRYVGGDPANKKSWVYDQPGTTSGGDTPYDPLTAGSESRARFALGMGPAVEAQRRMYSAEQWHPGTANPLGSNPYDTRDATFAQRLSANVDANVAKNKTGDVDPGTSLAAVMRHPVLGFLPNLAEGINPWASNAEMLQASKKAGGQTYANYEQAAKTFEAAVLPILSGAAVTPSEAQRQIKANIPEAGDSSYVLAQKAKQRAMMLNGAADLVGRPRPFPQVGSINYKQSGPQAGADMAGSAPKRPIKQQSNADLLAIVRGAQ